MRRMSGDRGSVTVVMAAFVVLLFAIGAMVIDVGAQYHRRRALQNGADAGALAIAQMCAAGDCGDPTGTAQEYGDANASGASVTVEEVCGDGVTGSGACADPPPVPAGASYVRVTLNKYVDFTFARLIGFDGSSMRARATVAWGGASPQKSDIPVTIGKCEYDTFLNEYGALEQPPSDPVDYAAGQPVIHLHDPSLDGSCPAGPAGSDLPGGFGWLDDPNSDCQSIAEPDGGFGADTGNSGSRDCLAAVLHTVIHIPIFTSTNDLSGNNGEYYMAPSLAAFYVTGYRVPGHDSHPAPCANSETCISGFFVKDPNPVSGQIGGPSMGVTVIAFVA